MAGDEGTGPADGALPPRSKRCPFVPLRRIAAGGMGEVYVARQDFDPSLPDVVAIKRLRARCADDPRIVSMFREEALISCALDHPNVVQVWELGEDDDGYFLVMEHVPGLSLHSCLRAGGPLPLPLALRIASEVAAGLHHAHERRDRRGVPANLVHRDVSPGNVLLSYSGDVKLADFGIAKFKWSRETTEAGVIKGKYTYLSPEQARGEPVDRRTDVFGMGLLIFEMVTGRRAYRGDELDVLDRAARGDVEPLDERFPEALRPLVARALAREPHQRHATCAELREQLLIVADRAGGLPPAHAVGDLVRRLAAPDDGVDLAAEGSVTDARGEVQPHTLRIRHRLVRWAPLVAMAAALLAAVAVSAWSALDRMPGEGGGDLAALTALPVEPQVEPVAPPLDAVHPPRAAAATARSDGRGRAAERPQAREPRRRGRRDAARQLSLDVVTAPPTEVLLGSRVLGTTPLRVPFPAGKRRLPLTFRNRELGLLARRSVTARPAGSPLQITFAKGRIVFAVKPGMLVRLDGRTLGMSPVPPAAVYEGPHTVMLTSPFRYATERREVRVKPAAVTTVSDNT